jgi:hypothetical protein
LNYFKKNVNAQKRRCAERPAPKQAHGPRFFGNRPKCRFKREQAKRETANAKRARRLLPIQKSSDSAESKGTEMIPTRNRLNLLNPHSQN